MFLGVPRYLCVCICVGIFGGRCACMCVSLNVSEFSVCVGFCVPVSDCD